MTMTLLLLFHFFTLFSGSRSVRVNVYVHSCDSFSTSCLIAPSSDKQKNVWYKITYIAHTATYKHKHIYTVGISWKYIFSEFRENNRNSSFKMMVLKTSKVIRHPLLIHDLHLHNFLLKFLMKFNLFLRG